MTVVIPTHNDAEMLRACLESIFADAGDDDSSPEVIVVADGSRDHPEQVVASFPARCLRLEGRLGAAHARNRGVDQAKGDIILFTDADCVVTRGWASRLGDALTRAHAEDEMILALCGAVDSADGWLEKSHAYAGYAYVQGGAARRTDCFNTANAAIFKRCFQELGGFSEELAAHEDHDFGLRLAESGARTLFLPEPAIFHHHGVHTLRQALRKHYRWGQTAGLLIETRHPHRLGRWLPVLRHPLGNFLAIVPLALATTSKIVAHLWPRDRRVILYAPVIFLLKVTFRWAGFRHRQPELITDRHRGDQEDSEATRWKREDRRYHEQREVAESYDRRVTRFYRLDHRYITLDPWATKIKAKGKKRVLDYGCGTGNATLRLRASGLEVTSIDASLTMLATTRTRARARDIEPVLVQADGEHLPFRNRSFDAVVCTGVLHHLPEIPDAVAQQTRVLTEDGLLFISEPYQHRPWLSVPGELALRLAKALRDRWRSSPLGARERPLNSLDATAIGSALEGAGMRFRATYFAYWPYACGYLPEAIAWPLMRLLNVLKSSLRGDGVRFEAWRDKS